MMEANLFSKKLIKCLSFLLIFLFPFFVSASERLSSFSVLDQIQKKTFKNIIDERIMPNMPPTFRGAVDDLIDSTVAVVGSNSNFGSGVLLSNTEALELGLVDKFGQGYYIATVDHVVQEPQDYAVVFYNPNTSELDEDAISRAEKIGANPDKDLALLKIYQKPDHASGSRLVGNSETVSIGDDVQAVGHPNSMWWTYTRGYISQFRNGYRWFYEDENSPMEADVVQTQTPITTGNSGGPLFTQEGKILGLNAFGDPEFQSINFAVSAEELRSFALSLSKLPKTKKKLSVSSIILPNPSTWKIIDEFDMNEDGRIDAVAYDTDGDGKLDLAEFDLNYDGISDQYEYDIFDDEKFSLLYLPATSDFYAEWQIDSDNDGEYDLKAVDKNDDGLPDRIEQM